MRDDPSVIALVTGATDGDQPAWDAIVERFSPLVWSICRRFRLSESDANDVGQNVWLRLVEYLPSLRVAAALPGWLATTTRRECIRVRRVARQHDQQSMDAAGELPADEETTEVDRWVIAAERDHTLRTAFSQLPSRCRDLLAMLMRDPAPPYAQISADLHIPVGSIGPTRARCLDQLRRNPLVVMLRDEGDGTRRDEPHDGRLVGR